MQVYGHRGASAERPENTLAAFRRAVELGAAGIELDVHLSGDGVPVVIHDATLDRTTDGTGPVDGRTAAELAALDAGGGEGVPTLAQVLDLIDPGAGGTPLKVNIEIKSDAAAQAMLDEVAGRPGLRWAVSSFDWSVIRYVRSQHPDAELWPTTFGPREAMDEVITRVSMMADTYPGAAAWADSLRTTPNVLDAALALAAEVGATAVSVGDYGLTPETVDLIHRHGLRAWVWTVNDPERARELAGWGVDDLCTDDPGVMLGIGGQGRVGV
jgi:glycerophosphoryl diester phosphodiesterase